MIAECVMKVNGKWYSAGDEVPADYTKKEIQASNASRLRKIAEEVGIDGADLTASELKVKLIEKLGL